ncbi:hypothetical protein LH935_03545 [Gordonia polyisoprenivorans]|uniref:hypothetical protein n=1 Tax=Gordonia polyisoprenivorans TaxID=84595 RepID=UPI00223487B1|nr:hypothetical protein LH935_03545 [Gordonia polyisoprenivorans]
MSELDSIKRASTACLEREYHKLRTKFCEKALGIKCLADLGVDGMGAAWRTYDSTAALGREDREQAIRDAVEHNQRCRDALSPTAGTPSLSEGGQVKVSWTESATGKTDLSTWFSASDEPDTSLRVDEWELTSRADLNALISDLQRAALAWEWLEIERREAAIGHAEFEAREARKEAREALEECING